MSHESPPKAKPSLQAFSLPTPQKIERLKDRAAMLAAARLFFHQRDVREVDCPSLSAAAAIDTYIDLIPAMYLGSERRYLHSSPEYGMKRLLAAGMGDIYQLSHVFRDGEWGARHNPEFMMAEWYRCGASFEAFILETAQFIELFLGPLPLRLISYRQAFHDYAGIDYLSATPGDLHGAITRAGIIPHVAPKPQSKEELLNLLLATCIEPALGQGELTALIHYPASQAALARRVTKEGEDIALRFELYYQGMELANGYHELAHAHEQRQRLHDANQQRTRQGRESLPLDEPFLAALEHGLPDCCGVAVGFDRLMMLRHKASNIHDVIPFGRDQA